MTVLKLCIFDLLLAPSRLLLLAKARKTRRNPSAAPTACSSASAPDSCLSYAYTPHTTLSPG